MADHYLLFRAYPAATPSGTALGTFTKASGKSVTIERNGVGSGRFTINRHEAQAAWAATGVYVRCWRDAVAGNALAGFWIKEGGDTLLSLDEEGGEDMTRGGPGPIACLGEARVWDRAFAGGDGHIQLGRGRWHWDDTQPGKVMNRLLNEAQARGCIPFVTWDFTATHDSDGNRWSHDAARKWNIPIGLSLLEVVGEMRAADMVVEMSPEFVLHMWEHPHGSDLSATIVFTKGTDIRDTSERQVIAREGHSHALVEGTNEEGDVRYRVARDSAVATTLGRRVEGFVSYPRTDDPPVLRRVGRRSIRRSMKLHDGPLTIGVLDKTNQVAMVDYVPGDTVTIDIPGEYDTATDDIASITLADRDEGAGEYDPTLQFGDLGLDPITGYDFGGDRSGVRRPGGGGDRDVSGDGGDTGGETGTADLTEHLIDDYIRPALLNTICGTLAAATEWDVPIPDGTLEGMLLVAFLTGNHEDWTPVPTGWTLDLDAGFDGGTAATRHGYAVMTHVVDGTEGYTGEGDTFHVEKDVGGGPDFLDYWVGQVSGAGTPLFEEANGASGNANPDLSGTGPTAIGNLFLALAGVKGSDGTVTVTAPPAGYTMDCSHPGDASIDGRNGVGVAWMWSTADSDDPGAFTNTSKAWWTATILIPTDTTSLGFLPVAETGAWWEGTNAYIIQNDGAPGTFGITDGILWAQSEDAGGGTLNIFIFQLDGFTETGISTEPELPVNVGTWSKSGRFRFSRDDVGGSSVVMSLEAGSQNVFAVYPPSSTEGTGIYVKSGANDDTVAWAMTNNAWYRYRWERDEQSLKMRARVWADADDEPTAWDVTCDVDLTTDVGSSLVLTVQLGNDDQVTPGQRWEMDWRKARGVVTSGQAVVGDLIAVADGVTDIFALPFIPRVGTVRFYVDGIVTPPLSIDYDAPSVTFTSDPSSFARITWDAVRA